MLDYHGVEFTAGQVVAINTAITTPQTLDATSVKQFGCASGFQDYIAKFVIHELILMKMKGNNTVNLSNPTLAKDYDFHQQLYRDSYERLFHNIKTDNFLLPLRSSRNSNTV